MANRLSKVMFIAGLILIAITCILWACLLVIPILPIAGNIKAGFALAAVVLGEIAFWVGTICVGKEFINKYKKRFKRSSSKR